MDGRVVVLGGALAVGACAVFGLWGGPASGDRAAVPSSPDAIAAPSVSVNPPGADIATRLQTADAGRGTILAGRCAACHSMRRGGQDLEGPNLFGVVGAPIGQRRSRYAYTAALRHVGGTWDARTLDTWLTDPRRLVPGTSMSFPGLADPRDRADVIAYLTTLGAQRQP